jgi:hypothetical protein
MNRSGENKVAYWLHNYFFWQNYGEFDNGYQFLRFLCTDKEVNYLTLRNDGTISYLPAGKEHKENSSGDWSRDNRQHGKPAKVIRKVFTKAALRLFTDKDFEQFANMYKADSGNENYKFELLDNSEIPDVYDMRIAEGGSSLSGSCMNSDGNYMDIYKYCDSVKILTLKTKSGNLLAGRALVWTIDGHTIMDRVYVSQDCLYEMFIEYAKDNNWWYKQYYRTYQHKTYFINPDTGESEEKRWFINTNTNHRCYPYIDTFSYGGDGFLQNWSSSETYYTYDDTSGGRSGFEPEMDDDDDDEDMVTCYDDVRRELSDCLMVTAGSSRYHGSWFDADDVVEIDGNHYYKEDDNYLVEIDDEYYRYDSDEVTQINGTYYLTDDVVYDVVGEEDIHKDDAIYSEYHNGYIREDESVFSHYHATHIHTDKAVKIAGKWYHEDDNIETDDMGYPTNIDECKHETQLSINF